MNKEHGLNIIKSHYHFKFHVNTRHYRVWIHTLNIILISLSVTFIFLGHYILDDPRLVYFFSIDLHDADFPLAYIYTGPAFQIAISLLGIAATVGNRPSALKWYWYLSAVLLILDIGMGLAWVPRFKKFHQGSTDRLKKLLAEPQDSKFCVLWNSMQEEFRCCGVDSHKDWLPLTSFCHETLSAPNRLPYSCCAHNSNYCNSTISVSTDQLLQSEDGDDGCLEPLLKWLHGRGDILFMFGYCTLFLVKVVSLVILRREIRELLTEIYHERENPPAMRRISDYIGVANTGTDELINLKNCTDERQERKHDVDYIGKAIGVEV